MHLPKDVFLLVPSLIKLITSITSVITPSAVQATKGQPRSSEENRSFYSDPSMLTLYCAFFDASIWDGTSSRFLDWYGFVLVGNAIRF